MLFFLILMHFIASVVDIDNKQAAQKEKKRKIDIHICIVHKKLDQLNI